MDNAINIDEDLDSLNTINSLKYSKKIEDYFRFYGLDFSEIETEHIFGTFESVDFKLTGHIYKPAEYKATVFVLHGYLNHSAELKNLIGFLLEHNFAVAVFDMPGHGLSTGQQASIDNFSQYSAAFDRFITVVEKHLDGPYHVIGFSTGASTVMDYLFFHKRNDFDKVIFVAPLIHYIAWKQSKNILKFYSSFADSIPRPPRKVSSDKDYLKFAKNDPLQPQRVPVKWVNALHEWNEKIADVPICDSEILIIQGALDKTVDWKFNIDFLKNKFRNVEVNVIDNCRHEIFNETPDVREKALLQIAEYLEA